MVLNYGIAVTIAIGLILVYFTVIETANANSKKAERFQRLIDDPQIGIHPGLVSDIKSYIIGLKVDSFFTWVAYLIAVAFGTFVILNLIAPL